MASSANRYARAIFELASEEGKVDDWARQLSVIRVVLDDPGARAVIDNPSVAAETRMKAVEQLDLPGIGPQGMNLMRMLVASGRVGRIDEIATQFEILADDAAGRVRATVTTAIPLSETDRESLARDLSSQLGKDVRLESREMPRHRRTERS